MSRREESHKVFTGKEIEKEWSFFFHVTSSSGSLAILATRGCTSLLEEDWVVMPVGYPRLYLAVSAQSRLWVVIGEFRYLSLMCSGRLNKGVNADPVLFITTVSLLWDPNCGQGVDSRFISLLLSSLQIFFFPLKNSTRVFKIRMPFHPTLKCVAVGKFVLNNMTIFLLLGKEVLAANRLGNVESLTFDWISRNLYWTDGGLKSVSVMKLADKSRRQIISNLNNPRSIVVHPTAGYVRAWNSCMPSTEWCPVEQTAYFTFNFIPLA